jgi:hypothetical protein
VRRPAESERLIEPRRGDRMGRRELMLLLGGAMTAARSLRAQQTAMSAVGYLPTLPDQQTLALIGGWPLPERGIRAA